MPLSKEQQLQLLLLEKEKRKRVGVPEKPPENFLSKVNTGAKYTVKGALDLVNAPFEVVGETMRKAVEANNPGDFRAPTIMQDLGLADRTAQPPENPFSLVNKLLRATAGGAARIAEGPNAVLEGARQAYSADRGVPGAIEDAMMAALMGKLAPNVANAPVEAATKGLGMAKDATKFVTKKIGKAALRTLGPSSEALSLRYNRPDEVATAKSIDELSGHFTDTLNGLQDKVRALDDEAWNTLLKLKAEPKSKIVAIFKSVRKDVVGKGGSKIGDADRAAVAKLDEYIERIQELKQPGATKGTEQFLDQEQLREMLQSLRRDANYSDPKYEPLNAALKSAASKVNAHLKQNGNYAEVMDRLAPATRALENAKNEFKPVLDPGAGKLIPSNTTAQKINLIVKEKRPQTTRTIKEIKDQTGVDFVDQVKLAKAKEQFNPGAENSRGSARTLAGSLAGMVLEPFIPGPQGLPTLLLGAAGRASDYYGGAAAGKIIDLASKSGTKVGGLLNQNPTTSRLIDLVREIARRQPFVRPFLGQE